MQTSFSGFEYVNYLIQNLARLMLAHEGLLLSLASTLATGRLANHCVINWVMVEVQSSEYLGEDDIVRFQDVYGRA